VAPVARRHLSLARIPCYGAKVHAANVSVPSPNPCNLCNRWLSAVRGLNRQLHGRERGVAGVTGVQELQNFESAKFAESGWNRAAQGGSPNRVGHRVVAVRVLPELVFVSGNSGRTKCDFFEQAPLRGIWIVGMRARFERAIYRKNRIAARLILKGSRGRALKDWERDLAARFARDDAVTSRLIHQAIVALCRKT